MINTREAPSVSDVFGPGAAAAVLAAFEVFPLLLYVLVSFELYVCLCELVAVGDVVGQEG